MKKFPEKRILITGAGSGLGRALALEYAKTGWRVCATDINQKNAKETEKLIQQNGNDTLSLKLDVSRYKDFEKALGIVKKRWGGIDVLINNAGVASGGYMEMIPMKKWQWILNINLLGVIHGCKSSIPLMKKQGYGYIINIASYAGFISFPEMSSYNVTKAGVISLSETLRIELSGQNIGVSVVTPSFFKTNLMNSFYSPDKRQRELANKFFEMSSVEVEKIAHHIYKKSGRGRFYIIYQSDAKILRRLKNIFPSLYIRIVSLIYRKGISDRFLLKNKGKN